MGVWATPLLQASCKIAATASRFSFLRGKQGKHEESRHEQIAQRYNDVEKKEEKEGPRRGGRWAGQRRVAVQPIF